MIWYRAKNKKGETFMPSHKSRMIGCLLGGAIGDAMGYPVEFMRFAEIVRYFGGAGVRERA